MRWSGRRPRPAAARMRSASGTFPRRSCCQHAAGPGRPTLRQGFLLLEWQSAVTFLYPCVFGRIPVGCALFTFSNTDLDVQTYATALLSTEIIDCQAFRPMFIGFRLGVKPVGKSWENTSS